WPCLVFQFAVLPCWDHLDALSINLPIIGQLLWACKFRPVRHVDSPLLSIVRQRTVCARRITGEPGALPGVRGGVPSARRHGAALDALFVGAGAAADAMGWRINPAGSGRLPRRPADAPG